jgi:uncharacterized membrane protein
VAFLMFVIVAGLAISATALAGHPRAATIEFICAVLVGSTVRFWPQKRVQVRRQEGEGKRGRVYFWFGVILIAGAFLQLLVRSAEALVYHARLSVWTIVEFAVTALLAIFLFSLGRQRTSSEER